jgi:hypothetical protein
MTTLAEAQARLQEYLDAESACLAGQEVRLTSAGGIDRAVVLPDLREIRRGIAHWRGQVALLQARERGAPTIGGMTFSQANFGNGG